MPDFESHTETAPEPEPSLKNAAAAYFAARSELIAIEASEASSYLKQRSTSLIVGGVLAFIGYLFVIYGLTHGLAKILAEPLANTPLVKFGILGSVAVIIGLIHLLVGLILLKKKISAPSGRLFGHTRAELQKDKEWLSNKTS